MTTTPIDRASEALDRCKSALDELDASCCEPGRSPRMQELDELLAAARVELGGTGDLTEVIPRLEDAGARIGRLQVTCCAPSRMKLYADLLAGLAKAQLHINRELGEGH